MSARYAQFAVMIMGWNITVLKMLIRWDVGLLSLANCVPYVSLATRSTKTSSFPVQPSEVCLSLNYTSVPIREILWKGIKPSRKVIHSAVHSLVRRFGMCGCRPYWRGLFTDGSGDVIEGRLYMRNVLTGTFDVQVVLQCRLFSRNVRVCYAVRHSLIWDNHSWKGGQVDGGTASSWYGKYFASEGALFPEWHCDMQLRSTLILSIPGGVSGSILNDNSG
jgi:hypothetical protein